MKIKVYKKLPKELKVELYRFEMENFYKEGGPAPERLAEEKEKYFSPPKAWLLVLEGSQIIGRTLLYRRKIVFENKEVIMGGFGRVCTRRDKRGQGIATKMLQRGMAILKEWNCDIAYLCAEINNRPLYARAGFVPLERLCSWQGRSGKTYEDNYAMIAPVNSPNLFELIISLKTKLHLGRGNW